MEKESKKTIKLLLGCLLADIVSTVITALLLQKDCAFGLLALKLQLITLKVFIILSQLSLG